MLLSAFLHIFVGLMKTIDQMRSSVSMSGPLFMAFAWLMFFQFRLADPGWSAQDFRVLPQFGLFHCRRGQFWACVLRPFPSVCISGRSSLVFTASPVSAYFSGAPVSHLPPRMGLRQLERSFLFRTAVATEARRHECSKCSLCSRRQDEFHAGGCGRKNESKLGAP